MKKLLFLLAIAGLTSCGTNTVKYDPSDIVLDVKVENMTVSKAALQVNRTTGAQFDLDKNGEGTAVLKGVENVYANLRYGDSAYKLFLQKGDRVKLTFDGRKLAETAKFEGKNADAVSYINQISYESYSMDFTVSIDEYMQSIEENKATAKALLKTRKLNETNPEFSEIENARID